MIRLFGLPANRTWGRKSLVATQWRSRSRCIILCCCLFEWPACGSNIVVRWKRALGKFRWKVRGLSGLVDRTLEDLPWLQVERHGIGIWFTLDVPFRTACGTSRDLLLYPLCSQQRGVDWISLVKDGSNGLVGALMVNVDAVGIGPVHFVYGVQVWGSGSTGGPCSAVFWGISRTGWRGYCHR